MIWGMTDVAREDRRKMREARLALWHPWFAWYPVRLQDGSRCWLEQVLCQRKWFPGSGWECNGAGWGYEYKSKP